MGKRGFGQHEQLWMDNGIARDVEAPRQQSSDATFWRFVVVFQNRELIALKANYRIGKLLIFPNAKRHGWLKITLRYGLAGQNIRFRV